MESCGQQMMKIGVCLLDGSVWVEGTFTVIFVVQWLAPWALKPEAPGPFFSKCTMHLLHILFGNDSGVSRDQNLLLLTIAVRNGVQLLGGS